MKTIATGFNMSEKTIISDKIQILEVDMQCTLWPDEWFGISLTKCCIEHDLGGSDFDLFWCVAKLHPLFFIIGATMMIGLFFGRPIWRIAKRAKYDNTVDKA